MRPSGEVTNTASFMLSSMMSSARPVAAWFGEVDPQPLERGAERAGRRGPSGTSTCVAQSPPESRSTDFRTSASGSATRLLEAPGQTDADDGQHEAERQQLPVLVKECGHGLLAAPGGSPHHTRA